MDINGARLLPGYLTREVQLQLVEEIRRITALSPLFTPKMPKTGKEMSVRMTNCGEFGWVTDKEHGYRYQRTHPVTDEPWPKFLKFCCSFGEKCQTTKKIHRPASSTITNRPQKWGCIRIAMKTSLMHPFYQFR